MLFNFFFIPELPGPPAGPSGRRHVTGRQEQDEPPQPRHLLLPRVDARYQRPPRPGQRAEHRAAASDPEVSNRDLAQESGGALTSDSDIPES